MLTDASLFQYNIPFLVSYTGTWSRRNRLGVGVAQNHPSQLASFLTAWIIPENKWWILMDRKHPKQLLPMRWRALQVLPLLTTTLCSYLPLKKNALSQVFSFMLWSVSPSFCGIWIKPSYMQNLHFTILPAPFQPFSWKSGCYVDVRQNNRSVWFCVPVEWTSLSVPEPVWIFNVLKI